MNLTFSWVQIIVIGLELILLYFFIKKPQQAIMFLFAWIPLESVFINFIPESVFLYVRYFPEVIIYSLLLLVLLRPKKNTSPVLDLSKFNLWLLFFIVLGILSALINAVEISVAVLAIRQIIRFIFLAIIIARINITKAWFGKFWKILGGLYIFEVVLGIIQYITNGKLDQYLLPSSSVGSGQIYGFTGVYQFWEVGSRVFATLGRYDRYGAYIGFITILFAAIFLSKDRRLMYSKWSWLMFAGGCVAVLFSSSRAAIFGMVVSLLWLVVIIMKKWWLLIVSGLCFAFMAAGIFIYTSYEGININYLVDSPQASIIERLIEPFSRKSLLANYYYYGRTFWLINTPAVVVKSSPFLGVGPGQFGSGTAQQLNQRQAYQDLHLPFGAAGEIGVIDDSWMSLWGEFGTLGLIAFMALLFLSYKLLNAENEKDRSLQYLSYGAQAGIIFIVFISLFANHFEIRSTMILLWLLPALIARWRLALDS
ncbi:MAG: O-antigen ligase family protein [Patescibacteria group bacterium]